MSFEFEEKISALPKQRNNAANNCLIDSPFVICFIEGVEYQLS
jgi:hypothetical protein